MLRFLFLIALSFSVTFTASASPDADSKPASVSPKQQMPPPCDDQHRHIRVNAIEYKSPDSWEIWINDQKITPGQYSALKELVDASVADGGQSVKIRWYDRCLDKAINVTLKSGQTYYVAAGLLLSQDEATPTANELTLAAIPLPAADAPLDQAGMDDEALILWAQIAASETMTFSFDDYQKRLQQVSSYFTKAGWEKFTAHMQATRMLDNVSQYQQSITSYAAHSSLPPSFHPKRIDKAKIVSRSVIDGRFTVEIMVPMVMTTKAGNKKNSKMNGVILTVQRVPHEENPKGIGIVDWKAVSN